jgi:hypothetical protein
MFVKVFRSDYLSTSPQQFYCEMNLFVGISKRGITPSELTELVDKVDEACIEHGAFRYMHTRTTKDPERRSRLDPNAHRAASAREAI